MRQAVRYRATGYATLRAQNRARRSHAAHASVARCNTHHIVFQLILGLMKEFESGLIKNMSVQEMNDSF